MSDGDVHLIPALLSMFLRPGDSFFVAGNVGTSRQAARESRHWGDVYSAADSWTLIGRFYFCAALSSVVIGSNWDGAFTVTRKILEIVVPTEIALQMLYQTQNCFLFKILMIESPVL